MQTIIDEDLKRRNQVVKFFCLFFSFALLLASGIAGVYTGEFSVLFSDFLKILTSPCPLVTDYFQLGNMGSALLNAGLCGLACTLFMLHPKVDCSSSTLAGYFLVIAHCFYGLNFLNMWPPFLGIIVFCVVKKIDLFDNLAMCMFSTAFGPFVSELLFRYTLGENFTPEKIQVSFIGIVLVLVLALFLGFAIPAMLPGALYMHKGYNLYNGGLAFGLLGLLIYSFMYKTMGVDPPERFEYENMAYAAHGHSYQLFSTLLFLLLFLVTLIVGWILNGKSLQGYQALLNTTGHRADYLMEFSPALVLINIGFYGIMILTYMNLIIVFTDGVGYTGATFGVTLAALTFSAGGQHPKNVWPILLGYVVLSFSVSALCIFAGRALPWTLSTQGYINGIAFATGLSPIAGHYGWKNGVLAGFICAVMCTSTSMIHGGFVLYNGGLTAGITALILVPMLEYYYHEKTSVVKD